MLAPSDHLSRLLTELQFCTAAQLASFEPEVRRLTGDLPGFDSCWLDVLVAHRLLTPWQAHCVQSDNPLLMRRGAYRLREPLGQRTWQAETCDRRRLVVMSQIADPDAQVVRDLTARAQSIMAAAQEVRPFMPSSVCLPREYLSNDEGDGGWFVSPYIPGWRLDELLIRGGRLPWPVVVEIGGELLLALHALQQQELNHGDVSLRNVRLQSNGQPVLTDPFTARLLKPSIGFRVDLRLRDIQHCAPELAGGGQRHDVVSDLYSLGIVLWQLLTARPPFISADAVTFLMQCRERDVEDVRRWVPDCPAQLAGQIRSLTRRRPELRPQTVSAVLNSWSTTAGTGFSATRRLLRRLPDRKRTSVAPRPTHSRRRLWVLGWAAAAMTGAVMLGLSSSVIPLPLNLRRTIVTDSTAGRSEVIGDSNVVVPEPTDEIQVLPEASADGVVQLISGQTYEARSLQHPGTLRIVSNGDSVALVEVPHSSWNISADQLRLEGIQIRFPHQRTDRAGRLLDVRCRVLELDRIILGDGTGHPDTVLRWTKSSAGSSVVQAINTVFVAGRYGIRMTSAPGRFVLRNVLFQAVETAWRCDTRDQTRVQLNMTQVTQRGGRSFADVLHSGSASRGNIEIICGDSVLTPVQSLVRLASTDRQWTPLNLTVAFRLAGRANPTIVLPTVKPVAWLDPSLKQTVALSDSRIVSESLLMAEPEFDSSLQSSDSFGNARLVDFDGPKRGQSLPGVDTTLLPNRFLEHTEGDEDSRVPPTGR